MPPVKSKVKRNPFSPGHFCAHFLRIVIDLRLVAASRCCVAMFQAHCLILAAYAVSACYVCFVACMLPGK